MGFNQPHMMMSYLKMKASKGKFNNTNPRQQSEEVSKDSTYGDQMTRAMAAHQNGLESFPPLAAGVIACLATGVDKEHAGQIACLHLLSRTVFNIFYQFLPPTEAVGLGRTVSWAVSLLT